jgi:hypothetical protein
MSHGIPTLETRNWNFKNDVKVTGLLNRSSGYYYLEDFFTPKPGISADTAYTYSTTFEVLGTNSTSALCAYSSTLAGLTLTTAGADNDQMIVCPHLTSGLSAWTGIKWGTENQTTWETAITVGDDITNGVLLWAGLKLTNTPTIATDADQAFFRFSTDDGDTNWMIESSIANVDTATDSGVAVVINTTYKFKIVIDSARKAEFYIDDVLIYKTTALTNDVDFIPYIGIQALNAAAEFVTLHYIKMSRILFE